MTELEFGKVPTKEVFDKVQKQEILTNLRNSHSRLCEILGGMNYNDQSYSQFEYVANLILTAEKTMQEGIDAQEQRRILLDQ